MKRYWSYLKYVLRHKWYVGAECFKVGLYWRGIKHDWTKFLPDEFIPYARFFYNADGSKAQRRDSTGYYKPYDTGDRSFDMAWLKHWHRHDHHWQHWMTVIDGGGTKPFEMSEMATREMVCDWIGAGKAQGFFSPPNDPMKETRTWYEANKDKMQLGEGTRQATEKAIYGKEE